MLVVTIVYAYRLNSKLNVIRNHKAQLKANIEEFHTATEKAIKAVKDLQRQGQTVCKDIDGKISKARLTADEIDILITSANKKIMEANEQNTELLKQEPYFDTKVNDILPEPYTSNFSVSSIRRKLSNKTEPKLNKKFNTVNEAELAKALREKQYRDALVS